MWLVVSCYLRFVDQWNGKGAFIPHFVGNGKGKGIVFLGSEVAIGEGEEEHLLLVFVLHQYPLSVEGGRETTYTTEVIGNVELEFVELGYIIFRLGDIQGLYLWGFGVSG